jgi:drug/metabolite transporter (DMT)-like permease
MPGEINLDQVLVRRAAIVIDPEESPEEHTARIRKELREHTYEMVKGYVLFIVIIVAMISVGILCAYEGVFDANAPVDTKRWALTILSALFAGGVSFVLGQATAKKSK